MPKPFTPWGLSEFRGENDVVPATEIKDNQGSLVQNLYIVEGGLERRLGSSLINTTLGSSFIQGLQWCNIDFALSSAGSDAAETGGNGLLNPLDPSISAYLQLYLRSDQVGGASGAAVATWPDISGHARDATQGTAANKPTTLDGASPNGSRMIVFDGANDFMTGTFPFGPGIDITNGVTIFAYIDEDSLTTGGFNSQSVFTCANSVSVFELISRTSSTVGVGYPDQEYGSNSGNIRDSYGATVLGPQILRLQFIPPASATASIKLYKDGVQLGVTQQNWQANDIRTGYSVCDSSGNSTLSGKIGAILVYNYAFNDPTCRAIEAYIEDFFEG